MRTIYLVLNKLWNIAVVDTFQDVVLSFFVDDTKQCSTTNNEQ